MGEWISIKDRLPSEDGEYLCCTDFNGHKAMHIYSFAKNLCKVDKYDFKKGQNRPGWYDYDSEWGYGEMHGVTHWMPLPALPDKNKKGEKRC